MAEPILLEPLPGNSGQGMSKMPGGIGSDALLEEFLEAIETLPNELKRGLQLMRELDAKFDASQQRSAQLEQVLLERAHALVSRRDALRGAPGGGFGGGGGRRGGRGGTQTKNEEVELLTKIAALENGTDSELMTIMEEFEQSSNSADEKIQVSYQLSDHVRKHLKQLEASIGEMRNIFFSQKGQGSRISRNFFFLIQSLKKILTTHVVVVVAPSGCFFKIFLQNLSTQDKSTVQLMLVKCQDLKLVRW